MRGFPRCKAHKLEGCPQESRWLVEGLWANEAVGIVGGEPKCCKSFLALDMAVAVASGTPCLRQFPVVQTGRVLLFSGEDAHPVVRRRLEGIALAAGVHFESLAVEVILTPVLRLDRKDDQLRLQQTVDAVRPTLLVLDPFVRLHRIDENAAADVAPLLGFLRELQRQFHTAVVLVHHARKGAAHARGGQALRGSSEIHAWGDSNLYLRRKGKELLLTTEQRAAQGAESIAIELREKGSALALHVVKENAARVPLAKPALGERIEKALTDTDTPLTLRELRNACKIRMERLCEALKPLVAEGVVRKGDQGFQLTEKKASKAVSVSPPPIQS